jgi:hypothetical protein
MARTETAPDSTALARGQPRLAYALNWPRGLLRLTSEVITPCVGVATKRVRCRPTCPRSQTRPGTRAPFLSRNWHSQATIVTPTRRAAASPSQSPSANQRTVCRAHRYYGDEPPTGMVSTTGSGRRIPATHRFPSFRLLSIGQQYGRVPFRQVVVESPPSGGIAR